MNLFSRSYRYEETMKSTQIVPLKFFLFLMLVVESSHAGFLGHNTTGDNGLTSATQPPPGTYLSLLYMDYEADTLRDRNGDSIGVDPAQRGNLEVGAFGVGIWWVSEKKLWGGNYSFMAWPTISDNKLESPIIELSQKTDPGFSDLYIQPINLGWHTDRADYMAGLGVYAPTGKYDADGDDNVGLGMWSFEAFAGATLYFDEAKSWHFATTVFYETHTEKKGTDIRVGDIVTLEGGLGKSWMDGSLTAGIAYFAQWKVTDDRLGGGITLPDAIGRHRTFGIGPEVTLPIASKSKLYGFLNVRYLWENGGRSTVEGDGLLMTLTLPIPSVPLR
jgi:hypothetical protein